MAGTPGDPQLPATMLTPSVPAGTPYPVIVSSAFGEGTQALKVGDVFSLPVEARTLQFRIEEIRSRYPGIPEGIPFVVASRDQLRADRTDGFRTTSAFYIRADDSAETAASIREQVRASAPFADVTGRAERTAELHSSPIIDAIVLGVALAGLLAALYAALAISAALALAGTAQAVEVAHLRTMGMTRREAFGLILVEHGPMTVIGFVAGPGVRAPPVRRRTARARARYAGRVVAGHPGQPRAGPAPRHRALRHRHRRPRDRTRGVPPAPGDPGQCHPPRVRMTTPTTPEIVDLPSASMSRRTRTHPADAGRIVCEGLVRIYKVADLEVVALQGLDLVVGSGEMIAIVGASGSGKSTLLNILGGLDVPSAGRASVAGHDLGKLSRRERTAYRRRTVGMVWQQTARNLLPYLTAVENVELPMILDGQAERHARALQLLDTVGLADRADHRPDRLSGGEQQRVAIAVALANEPDVLLADEPTGELDSVTAAEIFGLLRRINHEIGTTVVIVTHDALVSDQVGPDRGDPRRPDEHRDGPPDRAGRRRRAPGRARRVRGPRQGRPAAAAAGARGGPGPRGPGRAAAGGRPRRDLAGRGPPRWGPAMTGSIVTTGPMVETRALVREYPSGDATIHALRSVDLAVHEGRLLAVRGRSGSGKTTLLNLLGGLDRPTSGQVYLDGEELSAMDEDRLVEVRRTKIAFIFQAFGLIPVLSAAENVEVPLRLVRTDPAERGRRVDELLAQVGLAERAKHRPHELSGGEQQRVAIARALANRPKLLLADEPTGQLDSETGHRIMQMLRSVVQADGITAIVATHDPRMLDVADDVIELRDGDLVSPGS